MKNNNLKKLNPKKNKLKRPLKVLLFSVFVLIALLLFIIISLLLCKKHLENSTRIETLNGISLLEEITLGDVKQWIFIRGTDQKNPVLVFLHGGPGAPAPGMSSSRKLDAELIKNFTVVHWDQRGAGKSYNHDIPVNSMTIDRLVEDCNELIEYLRNRFDTQKVFMVAHSSGSVIGITTVHKYPEKIYAYVGVGQIINDYEQLKISYNFIVEEAKKSGDVKVHNAIKAIGPPPYDTPEELYEMQNYIFRLGGVIHDNRIKQIGGLLLSFFTSPEYSLLEGFESLMMKGVDFSVGAMWDEIKNINITKEIQSIKTPVYFFEGKYDMATPTILVENFYNSLNAEKGKKLIIFENSAHMPMIEEKEKYEDLLINVVLKESQED
ncbi:MAG: alpha/beta fold hydrolase [Planctomycetota bacterium]|jgi:pimeloyl-ACP methyl ester carboxylesterase